MPDRDVETIRSRAKFIATLRRVADALESGTPVRIQVAAKRFIVPATAKLSVEHEVEGAEEELELQLSWRNTEAPPPRKPAKRAASPRKPRRA
jgi:amphi-Trp domain-containing protein